MIAINSHKARLSHQGYVIAFSLCISKLWRPMKSPPCCRDGYWVHMTWFECIGLCRKTCAAAIGRRHLSCPSLLQLALRSAHYARWLSFGMSRRELWNSLQLKGFMHSSIWRFGWPNVSEMLWNNNVMNMSICLISVKPTHRRIAYDTLQIRG